MIKTHERCMEFLITLVTKVGNHSWFFTGIMTSPLGCYLNSFITPINVHHSINFNKLTNL